MEQKNIFTVDKLYVASTNKAVINVHCSSFPIDKVKLRAGIYETKTNVDYYVDFATFQRLAVDAESGRLFKEITENRFSLYSGYTRDGQVISRQLSLSYSKPNIFITLSEIEGTKTSTGAILPKKGVKPLKTVSVPVNVNTFREMMIYCSNCITAYQGTKINKMLKEYEQMKLENA